MIAPSGMCRGFKPMQVQPATARVERPRRGRRRVDSIPAERKRHLKAYAAHTVYKLSVYDLARLADVHSTTIRNWIRLAKTYPEAQDRDELMLSASA